GGSGRRSGTGAPGSLESTQRALQLGCREAAADEDDARAMVGVGPAVEVERRMDDVLYAVQEQRARRPDGAQPLHTQDVGATRGEQPRQPDAERRPVELLLEHDAVRLHTAVVGVCVTAVRRRHGVQVALAAEEDVWLHLTERRLEDPGGRV